MSEQKENRSLIEYQLVKVNQGKERPDEFDNYAKREQQISDNEEEQDHAVLLVNEDISTKKGWCQSARNYLARASRYLSENSWKVCGGLSITLSILVLVFYSSLKVRCPHDADHICLKEFIFPRLFKWIAIVFFNSIATVVQFHLIVKNSTSRFISGYGFAQSIYLFVFNDNTINLHYYIGGLNAIHIILLALFLTVYSIIMLWVACFKKQKLICLLGNIAFISIIAFLFYSRSILHGCDYWPKGINGEIENRNGMCKIATPSLCWYKITQNWQDISLLLPTCDKASVSADSKERIDHYFSPYVKDSRYIAFTNLNQVPEYNRTDEVIQFTVFQQAKGYSSLEQAQNDQFEVVFDRKELAYHIDVKFNETLANERKKISDDLPEAPLTKNILMIFIDAVGRQSMHLKMPKTVEWFEKRTRQHSYKSENKQTEEDKKQSQSFEFYKYNSLKPYTFDNLEFLMYGKKLRNESVTEENKLVSIVEDLKKRGYVTSHSSDQCQTLSLGFDSETIDIMNSNRFDHENQSYACDPNFQDPESTFGLFQGPYSIVRRCLYGKTMADYPIEYTKSFFNKYKDSKKFMHLEFSYGHEGTGEVINYLDDPLSNFLEEMSDGGYLRDTTVILFNDHGLHMQGIFYLLHLKNVFVEINLPGLFINIPAEINEKYGDDIALNQQNLVSIKNLHHFIQHITTGESYKNSQYSLLNPLSLQRYCHDIGVYDKEDCSCK